MSGPTPERPPASSVVWAGVLFALLAALIEIIVLLTRLLDDQFIHRSREFLWMTPAGYLLLFAVPIGVLWALYRGNRISFSLAVFCLATAAAVSGLLVLLHGKLHAIALLLLGLGIGLQLGRVAQRRQSAFSRLIRRVSPIMLGMVPLMAAISWGYHKWNERDEPAAGTALAGTPNVVLIILDTVRAASLSLYGYEKETTPELSRWGRSGVVFDQAISTAPWTLPSHASLFTGRLPPEFSADWLTPLDTQWPTLAEVLRDRGYRTGGFVANLIYATWEHGLGRGFDHYEDYPLSIGMFFRHTVPGRMLTEVRRLRNLIGTDQVPGRKSAERIGQDFLRWVDRDSTRPFFAFLNYYDAHDPYLPPQVYFRKFAGRERERQLSPLRRRGPFVPADRLTADELALEIAAYNGAIAYLDAELGKLFTALENRGLLQRTLIIVTSDHGEEFGEHGVLFHGHTLYRQTLHVPLLMLGAGLIPPGKRVVEPVSLRDIPATVTDLLRVSDGFPGASLSRFWRDSAPVSNPALSFTSKGIRIPTWLPGGKSDMQSVVTDSLHYIKGAEEQIFDWNADPIEAHDLAGQASGAFALPRLRQLLFSTPGATR
jgi:arylsulfatase A-like enzyme